ncbi:MAG TPA: retropepsin-like aspartic protease [Saprospiraceae bacterium]|nr:retropepsin-like aspartic protease [Saprospiraceae bacterium]HNT20560.1 retropepsin-like aspartic protease [Saprospiraceae bacterium]
MKLLIFIITCLTTTIVNSQTPLNKLNLILEFYNNGDYHSISEILKDNGFKLNTVIPRIKNGSENILENLTYIKKTEVKLICRICPNEYEPKIANESFSIVKDINLANLGPIPTSPYNDDKFVKMVNIMKTDEDFLRLYRNTVGEYMSIEDYIWSYLEPRYGSLPSTPLEVIKISYEEYIPFGSAMDILSLYSRTIKILSPYKILSNPTFYIEYTKDDKDLGWGKYYYYYKNNNKSDKLISDYKYILQEIDIEFLGVTDLNSSNSGHDIKLKTNIKVRNNRYYEDKIGSSEQVPIYHGPGGIYQVVIELNGSLKTRITFDTGAGDVILSPEIADLLRKSGALSASDYVGKSTYSYADGSIESLQQYLLKSIRIGNKTIQNVICAIGNKPNSSSLLGQSFLKRFGAYEFDYKRNLLIFK